MKRIGWLWVVMVVVLTAVVASGCALVPVGSQTGNGQDGDVVTGMANVESVELLIMESFPVQVNAVVRGTLPDGCTMLDGPSVTRDGNTFVISLSTTREADAVCTQALVPFESVISLDVVDLVAGVYTVDANGVTGTFELAVDNVPVTEAPPAEPTSDVSQCEALRGDGEAVFTNPAAGYCLRYPEGFSVTEPEANVVVISGPDYSGGPEPLAGFVNVQAWEPANGRTAAEVSDEIVAEFQGEGVMIERGDTRLGGVPAVEIVGVPGLQRSWQIVAVQNDRIVRLVFAPLGEEYGQATVDMEALLSTVARTFTFLPAEGEVAIPQGAEGARFVLAQTLGIEGPAGAEIEVVSAEPVRWSDACLGLGRAHESCAAVVTPGYRVTLAVGDRRYVYHTDEAGGQVRLAEAPPVAIEAPVLTWRHEDGNGCMEATFGTDEAAAGPCGAPMVTAPLMADFVVRNLPVYVERYASFEAETPAGSVVFTGTGSVPATPAEQRMIAEFARVASGMMASGHAGASFGLVLTLERTGGMLGVCETFEIYVTGEVFISSCKEGTPAELGRGRLTGVEMAQLFEMMDALRFFEWVDTSQVPVDGLAYDLLFFGTGDAEETEADTGALQQLIDDIFARVVLGEVRAASGALWLTLPEGWTVGPTRETVLGTLTVLGPAPWDANASNSSVYVADADDVPLEHAIKRIFCGPSDCEPDVTLEDVTVASVPAQRSVPAGDVEIAWYFLVFDGQTITFTLHDAETGATLEDVVDSIRLGL